MFSEDMDLYEYLCHCKGKRKEVVIGIQEALSKREPINQRLPVVENRKKNGDIETDLMMGKTTNSLIQYLLTEQLCLLTTIENLKEKKDTIEQKLYIPTRFFHDRGIPTS